MPHVGRKRQGGVREAPPAEQGLGGRGRDPSQPPYRAGGSPRAVDPPPDLWGVQLASIWPRAWHPSGRSGMEISMGVVSAGEEGEVIPSMVFRQTGNGDKPRCSVILGYGQNPGSQAPAGPVQVAFPRPRGVRVNTGGHIPLMHQHRERGPARARPRQALN